MTSVTQHLIKVLEDEIAERQNVIAKLRDMRTTDGHNRVRKPLPTRTIAPKKKASGWTPERLRQFRATMAAKKKSAAAGK